MRLLFSSAQIEYIQYWLHAMGLTNPQIPIPSSDYLIQANDLTNCSPVVYKDLTALKKANKVCAQTYASSSSTHHKASATGHSG